MIVFTLEYETYDGNKQYERTIYWLSTTHCSGVDAKHSVEIYEQLDAQTTGLTE